MSNEQVLKQAMAKIFAAQDYFAKFRANPNKVPALAYTDEEKAALISQFGESMLELYVDYYDELFVHAPAAERNARPDSEACAWAEKKLDWHLHLQEYAE